jgi:hypothetical protein
MFHGPASPEVPASAIRHTPPPRIQRDVPIYRARMSIAHSMEQCEVSVTIPLNPKEPLMVTIISAELDDTVE